MRAVIYSESGEPSVLRLGEVPSPKLQPGEIRIAVKASGVNRADTLQRRGHYPPPKGVTDILGLEVSGVVSELSEGVTSFNKGDRVMALLPGGGYAEEVCVDAGLVMRIPEPLSFIEAAAIPEVFITAHHNIFFLGGLTRGQTVLIHAGASGVGTAGVQLTRHIAQETWVTVGTRDKAKACEQLGAKAVVYKETPFADVIRKQAISGGVDIILDPVGGSYLSDNLKCLNTAGTLVSIGLMGGREAKLDLGLLLSRRLRIIGSVLRGLPLEQKRAAVDRFSKSFLTAFENGEISPIIDRNYPAAEAQKAHERMESNQNIGKLLLEWN